MVIYTTSSSGDKLLGFYAQFSFCIVIRSHTHPHTTDRRTAWADAAKLYFLNVTAAMFQNYQNQQAWPCKTEAVSVSSYLQGKIYYKKLSKSLWFGEEHL